MHLWFEVIIKNLDQEDDGDDDDDDDDTKNDDDDNDYDNDDDDEDDDDDDLLKKSNLSSHSVLLWSIQGDSMWEKEGEHSVFALSM